MIRDDQIGFAIAIDIDCGDGKGTASRAKGLLRGETGRHRARCGSVKQYRGGAIVGVRHDQVRLAVLIGIVEHLFEISVLVFVEIYGIDLVIAIGIDAKLDRLLGIVGIDGDPVPLAVAMGEDLTGLRGRR